MGQDIPAGWYDDPAGGGGWRWWDGAQWTEATVDKSAGAGQRATASPAADEPDGTAGSLIRTRRFWLGLLAGGLVVLGAVTVWLVGDDTPDPATGESGRSGAADPGPLDRNPRSVALPPAEGDAGAATRAFLAAEGAELVDFHRLAESVVDLPTEASEVAGRCREIVEGPLVEAKVRPGDLVALAARVPDESTGEMFTNEVAAIQNFLSACVDGAGEVNLERLRSEAEFTHVIVQRRLEELDALDSGR